MRKRAIIAKEPFGPIQESLKKYAKKFGFDFFGTSKTVTGYHDVLLFHNNPQQVELLGNGRVFWWMCDLREPQGGGDFAGIFLSNKKYIKDYEKHFRCPVYYLPPCGIDTEVREGRKIEWDAVFIGNMINKYHSNRFEILQRVSVEVGLHLIAGEGITKDQAWIYQETPISLSISLPIEGYTSNRLFNIVSSRGFCLVSYFPGIEELFKDRKHVVYFRSPEEAADLARFYLENEYLRRTIATRGYLHYVEKHRGWNRLDFIVSKIGGVL